MRAQSSRQAGLMAAHGVLHEGRDGLHVAGAAGLERRHQPLVAEAVAVAAGVRDAVGVEDEGVAGLELERHRRQAQIGNEPQQRPRHLDLADGLARPQQERVGMPARGQADRDAAAGSAGEGRAADGAVGAVGELAAHGLVEEPQHRLRGLLAHGDRADGVAGQARQDRRGGALATDVADREQPPVLGDVEEVVEVPARPPTVGDGVVADRDLEPRDGREPVGQQARLQGARHVRPLLVEPGALERLAALAPQRQSGTPAPWR